MACRQIRFPTESRSHNVRQAHRRTEIAGSYKGQGERDEGYQGSGETGMHLH